MRVFGESPSFYYELKDYQLDLAEIHDRLISFGLVDGLSFPNFQARTEKLRETIKADSNFSNLLNGIHVPFAVSLDKGSHDLGEQLETELLVKLESSFKASYPDLHFKAVIQGDVGLKEKISIEDSSRYSDLINLAQKSTVVGWYFPQALQEFDIQSQRKQMVDLPSLVGAHLCLSGGIDIVSAMTGFPGLLINEDEYPPVLCLSAYCHQDPRMILVLKSYGPHLEFWCMTQMLSEGVTQVSEQWAGGLTVFA